MSDRIVMQAHNTFDGPDAVHLVQFTDASVSSGILTTLLPPMSVTVLALSWSGNKKDHP